MDETQIIANGKQLGLKGDDLMNYVVAAKEEIVFRQREEARLKAEEAEREHARVTEIARLKAEETIRNADIERERLERQIRLQEVTAQKELDLANIQAQAQAQREREKIGSMNYKCSSYNNNSKFQMLQEIPMWTTKLE